MEDSEFHGPGMGAGPLCATTATSKAICGGFWNFSHETYLKRFSSIRTLLAA